MEIKHKNKPMNKKKLLFKALAGLCAGLAFGLATSVVVVLFAPQLKTVLGLNEENSVVIKVGGSQDTENQKSVLKSAGTDSDRDALNSNQQLNYTLYGVGNQAGKTLVGINLTKAPLGSKNYSKTGCGIILTQTSEEVLILANSGTVKKGEEVQITFYGGQTVAGWVYSCDEETGVLIIRVDLEALSKYTRNTIGIAEIGDSTALNRGQYVIAIGSPLGELRSTLVGELTSVRGKAQYQDREHTILETDILGKSYSEGFLVSETGKIIGILTHDTDEPGENLVLKAIAISDLSDILEKLCNEEEIPRIGMKVSTVSAETAKIYNIPEGIYVDSVSMNSPAMEAGIQKGDVVVSFGLEEISTAKQYTSQLMRVKPGTPVKITIRRYSGEKYREMTVDVTVGEQ